MTMPSTASPIDANAVVSQDAQSVSAMRDELGDELFGEILQTLFERSDIDLAACRQARRAGDDKALASAAHSMKGALLSLGFAAAAAIADTLQVGRSTDAERDLDTLDAVMREIRARFAQG